MRRTRLGSRVFGTIVSLIFVGIGSTLSWMLIGEHLSDREARSWREVECTIRSIEPSIPEDGSSQPYGLAIEYEYGIAGASHVGTDVGRRTVRERCYGAIQKLLRQWPAGTRTVCYVDPDDPTRAVLVPSRGDVPIWILPVPLLFVAIGLLGIRLAWKRGSSESGPERPKRRLGKARIPRGAKVVGVLFFLAFIAAGAGMFVAMFFLPLMDMLDADGWKETPCRVVRRGTWTESSGDRRNRTPSRKMDILYAYEHEGVELRSNQFDFFHGHSFNYDRGIWDEFPPGKKAVCYVDPSDPARAVLDRGFPPIAFFFAFFPFVFFAVGAIGMVAVMRGIRRKETSHRADGDHSRSGDPRVRLDVDDLGPVTLHLGRKAVGKFVGFTLVTLFWNGITSVFVTIAIRSFLEGDPEWFLAIFISPFVLIGLGLFFGAVHSFLALFNPKPVLKISSATLRMGDRARVSWEVPSRASRLERLEIVLEGVEAASYRSGKNRRTDTSIFHRSVVVDTDYPSAIERGEAKLDVPFSVPSFDSGNNKIVWRLKVRGTIPRWPDVTGEFELRLEPAEHGRMRS